MKHSCEIVIEDDETFFHWYSYTPHCPQKLALTSPTSGFRSVCIVRSRVQATEFVIGILLAASHVLTVLPLAQAVAFVGNICSVE
jgi:hypothetical protein